MGGGGRGVMYEVTQGVLVGLLEWEEEGEGKWEGEGRGKVCMEGWEELSPGEYIFGVQGTSSLFGSIANAYSFSFFLLFLFSFFFSPRQLQPRSLG